ncbi:hypothetical protein C8F04DRAFT_1271039 [Mycena alexandri]|uniref:Cysteine protease n=1 Tax=Mycena alexandri TaxID=1745969 RepID=A0AAD6WUE6_9AGAR|nr:hypothetical protein C8F04DRAFT_1271039 [Mycena alexandri]
MSPDFGRSRGASAGHSPMTEDELVLRLTTPTLPRAISPGARSRLPRRHSTRAHSAAELRTLHCERVRKMPMSGLDPSMLIGFVCRDRFAEEGEGAVPRTIFAIVDEPPTWPGADDDDDMCLENGDGDGDSLHITRLACGVERLPPPSRTRTPTTAPTPPPTRHPLPAPAAARLARRWTRMRTPVAPITPLPGSRFDLGGGPTPAASAAKGKSKTAGDAYAELEGDDSFVDAGGEIDDWIDPVSQGPPSPKNASSKSKGKGKSTKAVPMPSVHYPFSVSVEDGAGVGPAMPASPPHREREQERQRNVTRAGGRIMGQRMHTARARDGEDAERRCTWGADRGLSRVLRGLHVLVLVFDFGFDPLSPRISITLLDLHYHIFRLIASSPSSRQTRHSEGDRKSGDRFFWPRVGLTFGGKTLTQFGAVWPKYNPQNQNNLRMTDFSFVRVTTMTQLIDAPAGKFRPGS